MAFILNFLKNFFVFAFFSLNLYKSKKSRADIREKENKNNIKAKRGRFFGKYFATLCHSKIKRL